MNVMKNSLKLAKDEINYILDEEGSIACEDNPMTTIDDYNRFFSNILEFPLRKNYRRRVRKGFEYLLASHCIQ